MKTRSREASPSIAYLTALVGHELRAPIAAALALTHVAEQRIAVLPRSEGAQSTLTRLDAELRRLEGIISRVIELQIRGRAVIQPRRLNLRTTIRDAVERTIGGRQQAAVVLKQRGDLRGWWDDIALAEIVENLLSNALKFGDGRPVEVTVAATRDGARITVSDEGRGISDRDRNRIFGRGVSARHVQGGGLGLGLWFVKEIATAHGGSVAVQSRPKRGSRFVVTIPQSRPNGGSPHGRGPRQTVSGVGVVHPSDRAS